MFTLRIAALITLSAISFASLAQPADGDTKAAADIGALGGKVEMESGKIIKIDLSRSKVTDADLVVLDNLKEVRELDLRLTTVGDKGLAHLKDWRKLKLLNLFRTPMTDEGLKSLGHLLQLETLLIGGTKVSDAGMATLKPFAELKKVSVFDTQVGDAGIAQLSGLRKLQTLLTGKSKVTEVGIAELKKVLPELKTGE